MRTNRLLMTLALALASATISLYAQTEIYPHYPVTVLSPSGVFGAFDAERVMSPAVVSVDTGFMMWYVGRYAGKFSIGLARSSDGINWVRHADSAVFSPDTTIEFESDNVWVASVIRIPSGFRMYYGGYHNWLAKLGTATSPDGVHWTRAPENPILLPGMGAAWDNQSVYGAGVIQMGENDFRMWYSGQNADIAQIGYATSTDGVHWMRQGLTPVLLVNPSSTWETIAIYNPRVVYDGTTFHMYYQGLRTYYSDVAGAIGYASSTDGVNWIKSPKNPLIGEWMASSVVDPAVILDDKLFRIWFSPYNSIIGYALSERIITECEDGAGLPITRALALAFPNPFNPSTTISLALPTASHVRVTIHDLLGREVAELSRESKKAGEYRIVWNADGQASGTYFYRVQIEPEQEGSETPNLLSGKLILLR